MDNQQQFMKSPEVNSSQLDMRKIRQSKILNGYNQYKNEEVKISEVRDRNNSGISSKHSHVRKLRKSISLRQNGVDSAAIDNYENKELGSEIQIENQPEKLERQQTENQFIQLIKNIKKKMIAKEIAGKLRSRMYKQLNNFQLNLLNEPSENREKSLFKSLKINDKHKQSIFSQISDKRINLQNNITYIIKLIYIKCGIQQFRKYISKISNILPVFQPDTIFKLTWDIVILLASFIIMFVITLRLSFETDDDNFIITNQTLFFLLMLQIIDIIINFNTGFYLKGELIENHWEILKIYGKNKFFTDLLATIPILLYIYIIQWSFEDDARIFLLTTLLRIQKFGKIIKKFKERWNLNNRQENILNFVKLFFTIVSISHLFACLWITFGLTENNDLTWLKKQNLLDKSQKDQYINAYYFATVTMITVGYGDILPVNSDEMILCIITMFIACAVFGYSMNIIGQIIQEFFKQETEINQNLSIINKYMQKKNVTKSLQYQIREYLEYYWEETAELNEEMEDKIINQLSNSLREKLLIESNKLMLKDSPIFSKNFSEQVISHTVPLIKEMRCTPEQIVFSQGENDECLIYFIQKGRVEVLIKPNQKHHQFARNPNFFKIKEFKDGDHFGTVSFFTKEKRAFTAKCLEFTTFLVLNRQEFLDMLKMFPQDYEKFREIIDRITLSNKFDLIDQECRSCSSYRHSIRQCPMIHIVKEKYKAIRLYNRQIQQRSISDNKRREKICTLNELDDIMESAQYFQEDYKEEIIDEYQQIVNQDEDYLFFQIACQNQILKQICNLKDIDNDNNEHQQIVQLSNLSATDQSFRDENTSKKPSLQKIDEEDDTSIIFEKNSKDDIKQLNDLYYNKNFSSKNILCVSDTRIELNNEEQKNNKFPSSLEINNEEQQGNNEQIHDKEALNALSPSYDLNIRILNNNFDLQNDEHYQNQDTWASNKKIPEIQQDNSNESPIKKQNNFIRKQRNSIKKLSLIQIKSEPKNPEQHQIDRLQVPQNINRKKSIFMNQNEVNLSETLSKPITKIRETQDNKLKKEIEDQFQKLIKNIVPQQVQNAANLYKQKSSHIGVQSDSGQSKHLDDIFDQMKIFMNYIIENNFDQVIKKNLNAQQIRDQKKKIEFKSKHVNPEKQKVPLDKRQSQVNKFKQRKSKDNVQQMLQSAEKKNSYHDLNISLKVHSDEIDGSIEEDIEANLKIPKTNNIVKLNQIQQNFNLDAMPYSDRDLIELIKQEFE